MRRFLTASAALLALVTTAPVFCVQAEDLDQVTAPVAYGDLNLSQASDAKIFASRLEDAARGVCLKANPDASPSLLSICADAATSVAIAQMQDQLDDQVDSRLDVIRTSLASP